MPGAPPRRKRHRSSRQWSDVVGRFACGLPEPVEELLDDLLRRQEVLREDLGGARRVDHDLERHAGRRHLVDMRVEDILQCAPEVLRRRFRVDSALEHRLHQRRLHTHVGKDPAEAPHHVRLVLGQDGLGVRHGHQILHSTPCGARLKRAFLPQGEKLKHSKVL